MADVKVEDHGNLIQLFLLTEKARKWVADNLEVEPHLWLGKTLCVPYSQADAIIAMMQDSGGDGVTLVVC